jgi:hypothetical protein
MVTSGEVYFGVSPIDRTWIPLAESATFMHELGHTLGLHHNGDVGLPSYSPNYISVMNYNYQLMGIQTSKVVGSNIQDGPSRVDYSNDALPVILTESSLDENLGMSDISSGNKDLCFFYDAYATWTMGAGAGPIDWNGNGFIDPAPVIVDLNALNGLADQYRGYKDWIHGTCSTSNDCPINNVRTAMAGGIPTHEPCVKNRCQSLMYNFQLTPWGMAD